MTQPPPTLHRFRVSVAIRQIVDIEVALLNPSVLAAQTYVKEVLEDGENNLDHIDNYFGEDLTWHPCSWTVLFTEHCRDSSTSLDTPRLPTPHD